MKKNDAIKESTESNTIEDEDSKGNLQAILSRHVQIMIIINQFLSNLKKLVDIVYSAL